MEPRLDALLAESDRLLEERAALLAAHAPLWARYGNGGTAALLRGHKEAKLKQRLRDQNPRWSETRLQEELSAMDEWAAIIKALEDRRQEYCQQKDALDISARRLALLTTRIHLAGAMLDDKDLPELAATEDA